MVVLLTETSTPGSPAVATATATPSPALALATATPSPGSTTATPSPIPATSTPSPSATAGAASPTPSPTAPPVGSATATPSPGPPAISQPTVSISPSLVKGSGTAAITVQSVSGGQATLRILHQNWDPARALWQGVLAPQSSTQVTWDTLLDNGQSAPSGVYYVVFTDGDGAMTAQKMEIAR
jgi:hypothetical protein